METAIIFFNYVNEFLFIKAINELSSLIVNMC